MNLRNMTRLQLMDEQLTQKERELIQAAAEAIEVFSEDELEAFAMQQKLSFAERKVRVLAQELKWPHDANGSPIDE